MSCMKFMSMQLYIMGATMRFLQLCTMSFLCPSITRYIMRLATPLCAW